MFSSDLFEMSFALVSDANLRFQESPTSPVNHSLHLRKRYSVARFSVKRCEKRRMQSRALTPVVMVLKTLATLVT